jgi:uncharacterized protein
MEPRVVHVPERSRYELRLGERVVGLADYDREDGRIEITHTEVDPELEGRGLGTKLVADALDDARRQGLEVEPVCPFVAHFMRVHPEYAALRPKRAERS